MKQIFTLLFTLVLHFALTAQTNFGKIIRSQAPFPIANGSRATLLELNDSSLLVIYNVVDTAVGTNLSLQKLTFSGQVLWEKQIALPNQMETLLDAVQLPDSSVAILCTYDKGNLIYDEEVYFVKVNLDGEILSTRNLTSSGICCWDIADGRLFLTQTKKLIYTHQSFGISFANGIVSIADTNLNNNTGFSDNSALYHATAFQDIDFNYLSFGHESSNNLKRALFTKRNQNQSFQWVKYFRHPNTTATKLTIADDAIRSNNTYTLLMHFEDTTTQNTIYLVKTNLNGDTLLTKTFAANYDPFGIYSLGINGFIMAASVIDSNKFTSLQLIRLDTNFTVLASQNYRYKNFNESCWSFKQASDGDFLIAASADSVTKRNIHILKIKPNLCVEPNPSFTVNYATGLGNGVAGILVNNTSDFGISDSLNTVSTIYFGDGNSSSFLGNSITHIYANQGTYTVSLTITTSCGTKTYSRLVNVPCTGQPSGFFYTSNLLNVNFSYPYSASQYVWNFGDGGSASSASAAHTYASPGKYQVCLSTNNSCGAIQLCDSITVACTLPIIPLPASISACMGSTITLDAGNLGSSFLWSDGQTGQLATFTASGNYSVSVTNSCGANATKSIDVQFQMVPQLAIGADTAICQNDQLLLTNFFSGGAYAYSWFLNNQLQSAGNAYTFFSSLTGIFQISLVADNAGCIDSVRKFISVNPTMQCSQAIYCSPTYTNGTSQGDYIKRVSLGTLNNVTGGTGQAAYIDYSPLGATFTAGQSVTLQLEFNEVNAMYYRVWIDYNLDGIFSNNEVLSGNAVNSGLSSVFTNISANAYGGPTRMRVRCANSSNSNLDACANYGYGQTEDYLITILNGNGAPYANFTADTTHIYLNDLVNFSDLSTNGASNWEWTFYGGIPSGSNVKNPSGISYPNSGCYTVKLKAGNANGFTLKRDSCYIWVDVSLGNTAEKEQFELSILPNPFQEECVLNYRLTENTLLEIYDGKGIQIKNLVLNKKDEKVILDLSMHPSGIYFVRIMSKDKLVLSKKLLKM